MTALFFWGECQAAPTSPALAGARAPPSKGEVCFAGPIRCYASKDFALERGGACGKGEPRSALLLCLKPFDPEGKDAEHFIYIALDFQIIETQKTQT